MVRMLVVLRGGYPWGFRMQGGGDRPLVVSKVTSTGKAGGAGVRAGCAVKAINGTSTAHLSLSNAHALTKQGSTLTLEIEDNSEEPSGNNFSSSTSISSSTTSASTVVAANGHITSIRRRTESSGSLEKVQDALTDGKLSDSDKDDSDSSVIFLETYGVDPRLLRNDGAEEDDEAATKQNSCPDSDSSSLCLPAAFALEPNSESLYSERSNDGSCTDQGSQTDSSTDTLVLDGPLSLGDITTSSDPVVLLEAKTQEDVEQAKIKIKPIQNKTEEARSASEDSPEDLNDFDSSFQRQSDEEVSSRTSSFFSNFEEKLEQAERQFPNLQAEDLLVEERERRENFISSPQLACEGATEVVVSSTEEKRVDETLTKTSCIRKLEPKMGQYYSSVSGAGASKGGDVSGSLPSSPRSSEGWRISMASTATVGSSATAGSDDTVAKDMSELSSVNSCLSDLDETQTDGKVPPAVAPAAPDPDATAKAPPVPQRKKQTSIKDAIDELESIEQAAQTLLLKRQCSSEDERLTPVPSKDSSVSMPPSGPSTKLNDKMSPQTRKKVTPSPPPPPRFADDPPVPPEGDAISEKLEQSLSSLETSLQEVDKEMLGRQETAVAGGSSSPRLPRADQVNDAKAEVKPPLPPNLGVQQPKLEVKRRLWTKSKETQPYISRESYNEEEIIKELERLRRSFQENDLNDFLDNLDNTAIEYDIEEAFLTQLLQDISEDVEALPEGLTEKIVVRVDYEATTDTSSEASSEEVAREGHGSPSASSKLEKVKEKITERIRKRKASKSSDSGSSDAPSVVKDDDTKSESSVVENQHITPQTESSTPSQPLEHESSALIITPDVAKAEDTKKGFNIAEFFKKGSPKYLRKKYKERKNRKSDLITTSESESEDPEACKKDSNGSVLKKNYENQSSLKGSHRSLNGAQDTKKEVRFDLDSDARDKDVDSSPGKITGSGASKQPSSGEALTRHVVLSSQRVVTCEPQQQETVVLKESQEIVQVQTVPPEHPSYALPVVVEDINSRAESILPKLPERVKPPRRKKMIPTPVQEISNQSADQDSGSRSRKVADARAEFLKSMAPGKESAPTLLPCEEFNVSKTSSTAVEMKKSTETTEDIPDSTLQSFNQQLQPTQQFGESAVTDTDSVSSPPRPPLPQPSEEIAPESLMQEDASVTATIQSTSVASDSNVSSQEEVLVAPIPVTSVASISIASPEPTKVVQPPRTLPLPVIQESMHEDQISLLTPSEPTTVSSSYGDTTPATPPFEDNLPSLYDNVNPFKAMLEQEKMMEDIISAQATAPTCQATAPTYQATAPTYQATAPTCQATAPTCQTENKTEVTTEIIEQNAQPIAKNLNLSLSQAARKSPEAEKFEIVDIDSLAAITAEMFKFAEEMEKEVPKKTSRPPHRINTGARRRAAARDMGTHTPQRRVETREVGTEPYTTPVRRREMSTTIGIQTETSSVRTYHEAASQTDTEYETDLETESEIEDNQNKKYDASKWTFGPVREQTLPLASPQEPQLQHLHKQQQRLIQELQKQTVMQPNKEKEKPEAPPRHYQDKMPLKVVAELKNILADLEHPKPAPSRAVVQPPRWDDQLSWPHGRLANSVTNNPSLESSKTLHANTLSTQTNASHLPAVPPGSPTEPSSQLNTSLNHVMQSPDLTHETATFPESETSASLDRQALCSVSTDGLATGTGKAGLPGARVVGGRDDRQQTRAEAPGPPAAPARNPQTLLHYESQNKQVKGNEAAVSRSAGSIYKIRANVYPSFAPVIKVPTGKPPVPRPALRRLSADSQAAEEGYQSDPGGRRSNGRHRPPPMKTKLPYQISEDRGYVTDTEVAFKKAEAAEKTLRSTWTPIGQLPPLEPPQAPPVLSPGALDQALQELGLDESTLLNEIEQILGVGSLTSKSGKASEVSPARPEKEKEKSPSPVKPKSDRGVSQKPQVPERASSRGVWTPGKGSDERDASGPSRIDLPDLPSFKDQPNVWTPARAGSASPNLGRKEYRKITYDNQSSPQRRPSQENITVPSPEESFAWRDANVDKVARSPTSTLPKVQNPTVTLLQKKREGQIPGKRPEYLKPDDGPKYRPDDKLYVIKREYESEEEGGAGRRFAVLGPKKVAGVGPTTNDGVPTTLKSGVKSEHQGEWYKRMFDSLHKIKDDDHIIIKYKVPRARYGGYMSEPEGYDSDIGGGTLRYATVDRRRGPSYEADPMTSSLPRECLIDLDPYARNTSRYVHQPGRIENYVPGYSSLAEKELKRNPEADVKLESQSQEPPPVSVNHRYGSQKMSMTHALKESGYESDSTLVFKKREDARRLAPDPRKTSQVYRQIQRGGDIPITGLQKPNPPKPKEPLIGPLPFSYLSSAQRSPPARPESPYKYESGEVNIHYRTPVRIEQKESIPEEELARRQEEHMKKVYENERRKKYLAELEDIERRRHTDNFTPLQKSPIPLNRYDDESSLGTMRGARTPDLKQVARALFNFSAQNKRELAFNKGDVVFIRRQIDKNWYEGESRGQVGIFPCNYVEIVPYDSIRTLTRKPTEGQARARFNFQAQTSMEMSLSKGELVVLTRRVDENWYEGRIGNRKGIFPVSYVDTLMEPGADRPLTPSSSPMPRPALPAANLLYNGASSYSSPYSTLGRPGSQNDSRPYHQSLTVNTQQEPIPYRALYNYKPQNDDELELFENDLVMVMEKCDDGWFVGTSRRTGLFGTFPGNYVEKV